MRAARAWGVTYREFYGWAPEQHATQYVPDGETVVGHTVTITEPRWDRRQRDMALALLEYEDGCCPGCGGHLDDTTAPEAEFVYLPDDPVRCHKCAALAQAKKKWRDESEDSQQGLLFGTKRRT